MILDHSALNTWRECKRKFYWQYIMHLDPGRSDAMERGTMAHEIMYQVHKNGGDVEAAASSVTFRRPKGMLPQEEGKYADLETAVRMLVKGYYRQTDPLKLVAAEIPLAYHIFGSNFYVGMVDGLAEVEPIGLLVVEYKTTGMIPEAWIVRFQLDQQSTGYVFLGRKNKYPVKGAILNILRATKYPDYVRDTVLTPDWLMEEFESEIRQEMVDIETRLHAIGLNEDPYKVFPKSTNACFNYNHRCSFHDLCVESPSMRNRLLELKPRKEEPRELKILERALNNPEKALEAYKTT